MKELKSAAKIACVYVTTIIGAGFASGQEIVQFFTSFGQKGLWGSILSGVLFALTGAIVLEKVYAHRIRNFEELVYPAVGRTLGWLLEMLAVTFTFILFTVMTAGSGSILAGWAGIPARYGVALAALLTMTVLLTRIRGVVMLSSIAAPFLTTGILLVSLVSIFLKDIAVFSPCVALHGLLGNWLASSLMYVGYNTVISSVALCNLLPFIRSRRAALMGGVAGGMTICAAALLVNFTLLMYRPQSLADEMPMLSIARNYDAALSLFYGIILWSAMFVSAVTTGFCFIERVCGLVRINRQAFTVISCAIAVHMAGLGFSRLISLFYPLYGCLGFFLLTVILAEGVKRIRERPFTG